MKAIFLVVCAVFSVALAGAEGCTIPVFRYALDRWPPDPYLLTLPKERMKEVPESLQVAAKHGVLNLVISGQDGAEVSLRFPETQGGGYWPFPFSLSQLPAMCDSLARTEIARRIVNGEAAVFVVEIGGDPAKDEKVLMALDERLRHLEANAQLPEQDPNDPESVLGVGPPLKIDFSILPLRWDDPREKALLTILRGGFTNEVRKEVEAGRGGPYVYPVFGQGRVLAAMLPEDVTNNNIDSLCMFLLDACSCQVKDLNPGWDLLIHFDWDRALEEVGRSGAWGSSQAWDDRDKTAEKKDGPKSAESAGMADGSKTVWVGIGVGAGLVVLFALVLIVAKRQADGL